jgi:penicillin-binding protein 1A
MRHRVARAAVAAALFPALLATGCSLAPIELGREKPLPLRTTVTASDGTLLARLFKQNRVLVEYREIPPVLIDAVLAAEDSRFFEHPGYDFEAIARAALANLEEGEVVQGGSTITQQYVKNTFFRTPARTFQRKARELRLAIEVEKRYSKTEILERYLNTVYFGEGAYGIKAATQTYFRHGLASMTLSEAALLAALIKSPAYYDPRTHRRNARGRRDYVLDRMAELRLAPDARVDAVKKHPLGVTAHPPRFSTKQPYFLEAVRQEVERDRRLGLSDRDRARAWWQGGLRVETTLDMRLQRFAETAIENVLDRPDDPAAALVAIRPQTGEIVAMVGGRDWSTSQVNLALGRAGGGSGRQPGSSFKPIVAATAMEGGIGLDTVYESGPGVFTLDDGSVWSPANYEGTNYGPMTVGEAMVKSVNGVFARLALDVGAGQIASQARLMGIKSDLRAYPSIALGAEEVSVLDMATAYATLANQGTAIEPTTIEKITLPSGEVLQPDQEVVPGTVSPGNAYLLTRVLQEVIQRGTGVLAQLGRPAAGKTGTTDDYGDAWFVGYTPQVVTAVWVGHPNARIPMLNVHGFRVLGGTLPAIIWRNFMTRALAGEPAKDFTVPKSELVRVEIDPATGLLAAPWCPGEFKTMLRQVAPTEYCPAPPPPSPSPLPVPSASPTPSAAGGGESQPSAGAKASDDSGEAPSPSSADPSPAKDEPSKAKN